MKKTFYRYILAFGSNLGNRDLNCHYGEVALSRLGLILRVSRFLDTEPLESSDFTVEKNQQNFLNYILEFQTRLNPLELYTQIISIENERGHDRSRKWAPRHLDIDILFASVLNTESSSEWESFCFSENGLEIPHKELGNRPFLLELLEKDFGLVQVRS